ncbi:IclR family transcriptional regulator [Streptomyces sp. NPDC004629]|uniref:IclR family transcriptional regulator n=1 Tax=Streptomyces sp. NPDC004629 TaxID=3364705 RepID=UPI00368FBD2F
MAVETGAGTQAIERAISLLSCFSGTTNELRSSELCAKTGLGQSTVSRMMSTLDRLGFVVQNPRTGLYRLGPMAVTLGSVALNSSVVYRAGRQIAQHLAQVTNLGVNLAELNGRALFYLCNFEGTGSPKSFTMAGRSAPLHATGLGKAVLSGRSAEFVRDYFRSELATAFTPHTITRPEDMTTALTEIRDRGYATEVEELAFGRACLAAPIRGRTGEVIAALSISGPLSAIDLPRRQQLLGSRLIEAVDEISVALGYVPTPTAGPPHAVHVHQNAN